MAYSLLLVALLAAGATLSAGRVAPKAAQADDYHREHVKFHFFNKDNADSLEGQQIDKDLNVANILAAGFKRHTTTKVLIHGYDNNVGSDSIQLPKNAYLQVLGDKVNVIGVDWSYMNKAPMYTEGTTNVPGVGKRIAELLEFLVLHDLLSLDEVHIIGHSLGAHVAGTTGESINGKLARITGLDPARPLYNSVNPAGRLSADDAKMVDTIHTNGGNLGREFACGTVDFYPNGGRTQIGCLFDFYGTCSHGRSYLYFTESIKNAKAFTASLCADASTALKQQCRSSNVHATMGEHVSFSQEGAYYLKTASSSPFSLSG